MTHNDESLDGLSLYDSSPCKDSNMSVDIFANDEVEMPPPYFPQTLNSDVDDSGNKSTDVFALSDGNLEDVAASIADTDAADVVEDSNDDDDDDIEIIASTSSSSSRRKKEKENLEDDDSDEIEIINHRKSVHSKPTYIPRDESKPKIDLSKFVQKRRISDDKKLKLAPIFKKPEFIKTEVKNGPKKNLSSIFGASQFSSDRVDPPRIRVPKPKQTKIDAHLKWKDSATKITHVKRKDSDTTKNAESKWMDSDTKNVEVKRKIESKNSDVKRKVEAKNSDFKRKVETAVIEISPPRMKPLLDRSYVTPPPPKQPRFGRPITPDYSPLSKSITAQIELALESPGFKARKHTATATVLEQGKKQAALKPKCKDSRARMNGYECACCRGYYDALGLKGEERREYVNRTSKHRGFQEIPDTPPRYWDIEAPTVEEQIELGYVFPTDSPLFKSKPKKNLM